MARTNSTILVSVGWLASIGAYAASALLAHTALVA